MNVYRLVFPRLSHHVVVLNAIIMAAFYVVVLSGCQSVPQGEPRTTMAVVHYDTRYTDGVTQVMAECAIAVQEATEGLNLSDKVVNHVYSQCLIENGATL